MVMWVRAQRPSLWVGETFDSWNGQSWTASTYPGHTAGAVDLDQGSPFALPVAEFIDLAAERARLGKEVAALAGDIDRTARKLANPDFVARAPEEVVEENRERLADAQAAKDRLDAALRRLESVG